MSQGFMSPLPPFTLESLVTSGQWTAAQTPSRKKAVQKANSGRKSANPDTRRKDAKSAL